MLLAYSVHSQFVILSSAFEHTALVRSRRLQNSFTEILQRCRAIGYQICFFLCYIFSGLFPDCFIALVRLETTMTDAAGAQGGANAISDWCDMMHKRIDRASRVRNEFPALLAVLQDTAASVATFPAGSDTELPSFVQEVVDAACSTLITSLESGTRASTLCALRCGIADPLIALLGNAHVDASNVMHALFELCLDSLGIETLRAEVGNGNEMGGNGHEVGGIGTGNENGHANGNADGNGNGGHGSGGHGTGGAGPSYTWTTEACSALVRAASRILSCGDTGDAFTCNRAMRVVAAAASFDSVVCDLVVELGTVAHTLRILKAASGAPRRKFTSLYAIELLFVTGLGYEGEHTAHINRHCIEAGAVRDVVTTIRTWHNGGNYAAFSHGTENLVALGLKHLSNAVENGGDLARAFLDADGVAAIIEFLSGEYSCPSSVERTNALELLSMCADVKENLRAGPLEEKNAEAESRAAAAESRAAAADAAAEGRAAAAEGRAAAAESRAAAAESRAADAEAALAQKEAVLAQKEAVLAQTKAALAHTKAELARTTAELARTKAELAQTKAVLNGVHIIVGTRTTCSKDVGSDAART